MTIKTNGFFLAVAAAVVLPLCSCASDEDNRPIPGTVESTDTKKDANENNTPRTNPTPNPEPGTMPGDGPR
jgi:hypothetical protein